MKSVTMFAFFLFSFLLVKGQNLVPNPQFELLRPARDSYNPSMQCYSGTCKELSNLFRYSPAQNWTVWLGTTQNYACVMTEVIRSGSACVPLWPNYVMGNMMHVKTTVGGSGIVNTDIPAGTAKVRVFAWVYVIKGRVLMGYGPTGNPIGGTTVSKSVCKWERLEITKTGAEACNQVILYADGSQDAEFFVDAVSVEVIK